MSDAVIAASVAAVVAVIGFIVNNIVTYKNTGRQLTHDREQKSAERQLALRREIYLGMAAHLQEGLFAVSDYGQLHIDRQVTLANWRKGAHFGAKLHLMAAGDLVQAYSAANNAITGAVTAVLLRRAALEDTQRQMNTLLQRVKFHDDAKEKAFETLRQKGREGSLDAASNQRLSNIWDAEHKAREELAKEHDELLTKLRGAQGDLLRFAQTEQEKVYPLLLQVARAARLELREPFDEKAYAEMLTSTATHLKEIEKQVLGDPVEPGRS